MQGRQGRGTIAAPMTALRATIARLADAPRAGAVLIAGGLAVRLAVVLLLASRPLADDAADYHRMAEQLLSGARFEPDWPPGLPFYLAVVYRVAGAHPLAGRLAMCALWIGFALAVRALARRAGSPRAGNLALAAFALWPSHVFLAATTLTQLPTALALCATCAAALALLERPTLGRGLGVGAGLAALLLVRPSNVLLALAVPPLCAWRTRKLVALLAPALVLAVLVGGWTLEAHRLTGRWLFVNNANSQNLFYGNNPWTPTYRTWWFGSHKRGEPGVPEEFVAEHHRLASLPPGERDRAFSRAAVEHIKQRPGLFVRRSLARVRTFFAFDTFLSAQLASAGRRLAALAALAADAALWIGCGALALVFLIGRPRSKEEERAAWAIAVGSLLYAAPYFGSFAHPTYHFPVSGLFGVAAALPLARWLGGEPLSGPLGRRRAIALAITLGAFAAIQIEWALDMAARLP